MAGYHSWLWEKGRLWQKIDDRRQKAEAWAKRVYIKKGSILEDASLFRKR